MEANAGTIAVIGTSGQLGRSIVQAILTGETKLPTGAFTGA